MCNQEYPCELTRGFHPCAFSKISNLDFDRRNIGGKVKCCNFLFHRVISDNVYGLYSCNIITLIILLSICLCTVTSQTLPMIDNNLNNPLYRSLGYNPTQQVQPDASLAPEISNLQPEAISSIPSANFQSQNIPQIPPVDSRGDSSQLQLQTSLLSSLNSLMRGLTPPNINQPMTMQQTGYSSGIHTSSDIPQANPISPSSDSNTIVQLIKTLAEISSKANIPQTSQQLIQTAPQISSLIASNDGAHFQEPIQTNNQVVNKELEEIKTKMAMLLLQQPFASTSTGQPPVKITSPTVSVPNLNTKEGCKLIFPNSALCELLKPSSNNTLTLQEQLYAGQKYIPTTFATTGVSFETISQEKNINKIPQPSVAYLPTPQPNQQQSNAQTSALPNMIQSPPSLTTQTLPLQPTTQLFPSQPIIQPLPSQPTIQPLHSQPTIQLPPQPMVQPPFPLPTMQLSPSLIDQLSSPTTTQPYPARISYLR